MKLLVVVATQKELTSVYRHFNLPEQDFIETANFDILITGVGMTATAFSLGQRLDKNYDLVLNVGIAGSFDKNISLGSLVNVYQDVFAELGAEDHDNFLTIDDLGFGKNTYHASYETTALQKVKGITVNKVHGNSKSIETITKRFQPQVESMEGAAVFYACEQLNIPCLQVRSISNYVTPRTKETWEIGLAIKNLNEWVISYLTTDVY
ncbi:futalosine hydrolase [Pedobacter frigiditerrae]|uniref:Futalosine hydrolase n=1 Tax=Pedobacter frigiditerrae TaxID=2530452 RepID=A0A4R0N3R0_9SPHI|nr:futalosine hydrolase [Pedobacter frigiditerrae]TCC94003.1 futalosine hydrolase [Pedobacter frigiditerrae]